MCKTKLTTLSLSLALATLVVGCTADNTTRTAANLNTNANMNVNMNANMNSNMNANMNMTGAANNMAGNNAAMTANVAAIMDNPAAYIGKTVTVTSEVEYAYGARAFRLDDEAVLRGGIDNDLLVITRQPTTAAVNDTWLTDRATVTGTVRNFVVAEIERDYGFDLQPEIETEFRNKPVLIADSVRKIDE